MLNKLIAAIGIVALTPLSMIAKAAVTLPKIIGNDMVLQRGQPVPIWGTASVGERVTVTFGMQIKATTTNADGQWKVMLEAMPASATAHNMTIVGTNTIQLKNILIGEVWLCSGQSNMEYSMRKNSKVVKTDSAKNSPVDELKYAKDPAIRIFLVTQKNLLQPDSLHTGWSVARDSALRSFSAAGYFFAKKLHAKLHVPVGVISAAIPGSAIEPWLTVTITNKTSSDQKNALKVVETTPGKFVPKMISPLAPFAIKGFLWYQGETNCFQNEDIEYTHKMEVLINGWRKLWSNQYLPFYYVQIAPFYYSKSAGKYPLTTETLPKFWEAQILAMNIPNTAMVVTTDLNNSPDELHPAFKWEVGRRLALVALAKSYGEKITYSGPTYQQMKIEKGQIEITFSNTGGGLISKDEMPLNEFEIAGPDGKFVVARAAIKGNKVFVFSKQVPNPVNVRFEWNEVGHANLYNQDGLPAVPFRTDSPYHFIATK